MLRICFFLNQRYINNNNIYLLNIGTYSKNKTNKQYATLPVSIASIRRVKFNL